LRPTRRISVWIAVTFVAAYRVMIRPFLVGSCKFYPTCSEYAVEAVTIHGLWRGGRLALGRILRCRPGTQGGIDPVPPREDVMPSTSPDDDEPAGDEAAPGSVQSHRRDE